MLRQLTAEQFLEERHNLPDAGQWAELVEGIPICLSAPDLHHGNTILNLSKLLAEYVQRTEYGYPCFDLGLRVRSDPDTIRFPAVAYFVEGPRFAESDKPWTDTVPWLVVELVSTPDRHEQLASRLSDYWHCGVRGVWVIDPGARTVIVHAPEGRLSFLQETDSLAGDPYLPQFHAHVADLFREPEWWTKRR
jgi:Uma2 family endonuclease